MPKSCTSVALADLVLWSVFSGSCIGRLAPGEVSCLVVSAGELEAEIQVLPFQIQMRLEQNFELSHLEDLQDQCWYFEFDYLAWALAGLPQRMVLTYSCDFVRLHLALGRLTGRVHEGCALCQLLGREEAFR